MQIVYKDRKSSLIRMNIILVMVYSTDKDRKIVK
jgi:hypothetical protein